MKQHNRIQKSLSMIFSLALILLLAVPSQVLAQEETPQPEPAAEAPAAETPAEAPVEAPAAEPPADAPAAEAPLAEEPVNDDAVPEAPAIAEPVIAENAVEQPLVGEPTAEAAFVEVVEVLAAQEAVLVDESGDEIPLASQQAAEALTGGDPWFMANDGSGEVIGYTSLFGSCSPLVSAINCIQVSNPVQAAINDPRSDRAGHHYCR